MRLARRAADVVRFGVDRDEMLFGLETLMERLEMLTQLHAQLKAAILVVLLVELLVMLVQLHVQLKVLVPVVLLPRLLEMLAQVQLPTQLKQPSLLAATRPAVPVAWCACGGPRWPLPAAPLEVAALPEAVSAGASLQAGWCPVWSCCSLFGGERSLRK